MADYIHKNILSQAYIHVEPTLLNTDEDISSFKNKIEEFTRSRSTFYLHPEVSIEVELEDGSLKARITVMGTIALLMQGIASYPDFREGICLLCNDSKRLAEYVVSESQFLTGSKHADVIRLEARTGIVGSIQKVISQLEKIRIGSGGKLSAKELTTKLERVEDDLKKLIDNIADPQDKELVMKGLSDLANEIPESPLPPIDKSNTALELSVYQQRRKTLLEHFNN